MVALVGLFTAMGAADQSTGPPRAPLRVATDLITVDVSVLDGDRRPVGGLTADDFVVFEDGRPRPVVAFSVVNVPGAQTGQDGGGLLAAWTRDTPPDVAINDLPAEGRLVAIVLDRSIPNGGSVVTARSIAASAVDQLGPGDVAAVIRTSGAVDNGRLQGFTADRRLLMAAIESTFTGATSTEQNPSPIPGSASTAACHCGLCVFDTLGNVVEAMSEAPRRRKVLLFIGSAITLPEALATDQCAGVVRAPRERLDRQLEAANVTVHAIDPSGVIATAPPAGFVVPHGMQAAQATPAPGQYARADVQRLDSLRVLPEQTGGRLVANTNTPGDFLPAIFEESRSYYLLGFEPASPVDGAFHRIEVRVDRRGTTVRARSGYTFDAPRLVVGADARTRMMADLLDALQAQQPKQDLRLSMSVAPFPGGDGDAAPVAVVLGASLPRDDGGRQLGVAVGAFDLRGESVALQAQTVQVSAGAPAMLDGLAARLSLPPGYYEIRGAVRDDRTGATGSVFSFVEVPDARAGRLALSGLMLRRESSPSTPVGGILDGLVPFVPTVARRFARTDRVGAVVHVRQSAAPGRVGMRTVVTDAHGGTRFDRSTILEPSTFSHGSATYSLPLPLTDLPPGEYLLRVEATLGSDRVVRLLRFETTLAQAY